MTSDLETKINLIRERYAGHSINIEWNDRQAYWAVAVSNTRTFDTARIVAFGGSRGTLLEAVMALKPVEPGKPKREKR